jgi:hypothetical protein
VTSSNRLKPVPPGFRDTFVSLGHKKCEKRYGASNAVIRQWIAACGGPALLAERRANQKTGRKAGGRGL